MRVALCMFVVACGRIGFDPLGDSRGDGAPGPIAWVGTFVSMGLTSETVAFVGSPHQAGNVVLFHLACDGATMPGAPTLAAAGWSFQSLGPVVGVPGKWATAYAAIAPNTQPASFTVSWDVTCNDVDALGDEFTNASGTLEDTQIVAGTSDCMATLTTQSAGDALWAACSSGGTIIGVGAGLTMSADDGHDDWSAFALTTDPAHTVEQLAFRTTSGGQYTMTATALQPR